MLLRNSIYFSLRSKFDICSFHSHSICCLSATRSIAPQMNLLSRCPGATHIERFSAISSRRRRYIERRISGAYRRRIRVSETRRIRHGSRLQKLISFLFVDMLLRNSIYFSLRSKFDICSFHSHSICCLSATRSIAPQMNLLSRCPGATHIERFSAISSRRRRYIERRISGAYRRRIRVSETRRIRHVPSPGTYQRELPHRSRNLSAQTTRNPLPTCRDCRRHTQFS